MLRSVCPAQRFRGGLADSAGVMPTRAEKASACTVWRVFWTKDATKKTRNHALGAVREACDTEGRNKRKIIAHGASYFDVEFQQGVRYDWVYRWLHRCMDEDPALWKLLPLAQEEDPEAAPDLALAEASGSSAASAAQPAPAASAAPGLLALKMAAHCLHAAPAGNPSRRKEPF